MPLFSFRTENGERQSASDACELASRDEAWSELTKVCSDLVRESARNLKQDSEWSMVLLDASNNPLFRIRLVAETLALSLVLACAAPLMGEPLLLI